MLEHEHCHFSKVEVPGERRLWCRKGQDYCGDLRWEGECPLGMEPPRKEQMECEPKTFVPACRECGKPLPSPNFGIEKEGWESNIEADGRYSWKCPECARV